MLNENLAKGMFLDAENNMKLADFYCFSQVLQRFSEMDDYSKSQFPNVYRWILQIQAMEGVGTVLKQLGYFELDELPFGLQPAKPKGQPKQQKKKNKQPKKKKQKKQKKQKQPPKETLAVD